MRHKHQTHAAGPAHTLRGVTPWTLACIVLLAATLTIFAQPTAAAASVKLTDVALGVTLETSAALRAYAPDISAPAGIIQTSSGKVLWARQPDTRYAPASTAKVMTALLVMRSVSPTDQVCVDTSATALNGAKVGLIAGSKYTVTSLLEAMLVSSGCDAAYALAVHTAGSEKAFVAQMNAEVARLGLKNTRFANCTGLDATGAYISARDLAKLTNEAMKSAEFRRIIALRSTSVNSKTLPATNLLLTGYPGCIGGKTGTTTMAGHTLVSRAKRAGADVTVVVMAAATDKRRYEDAARLLDWGVLHAKPGVSACFTTVFDPGKTARVRNIALAAAALEGRTLGAGRTASFNTLVGERTTTRGYVKADAIVGGRLIQQVGGGVCQVSTTLFNAALVGGLPIVERRPHSMYLSTYPLGRDATVSWGGPDLRFSNNTSSTVTIRALASQFSVTAALQGASPADFATFATTPLSTYAAMPVAYVVDPQLAPGASKVLTAGQPGLTTKVTRTVRGPSGSLRSTDSFRSNYPAITRVIAVGPSAP